MPATDPDLSEADVRDLERILAKVSGDGDLPLSLLRFVLEIAPTPNVDLVVLDEKRRVLLAWRQDSFGQGWHVPGSLIRHRERIETRLEATARNEFNAKLKVDSEPFAPAANV